MKYPALLYPYLMSQPTFLHMTDEEYFSRPEISNSELGALESELSMDDQLFGDRKKAYRFGTLLDTMITSPGNYNYFKNSIGGITYEPEEISLAKSMRKAFYMDSFCVTLLDISQTQLVAVRDVEFQTATESFVLPMKCKFDFFVKILKQGYDLKSTVATSQQQFENVCERFNYDRQTAVYMTIANIDRMGIIGISKKNNKIFKKLIQRGDETFNKGYEKMLTLAYKYHLMFG